MDQFGRMPGLAARLEFALGRSWGCAWASVRARRGSGFGVIAGLSLLSIATGATAAGKLDSFPGYWTGFGKVQMSNGNTEQVKCVVVYKVTGEDLRQTVRCASQGFSFNGTSELHVTAAGKVTGTWTENTYSATGDVTGNTTDKGMKLAIAGATFTAAMDVATTGCKQTLDIVPQGLEVKRISLGLGKC